MKEISEINIDTSKYKGIADDKLNYFADLVELITIVSKMEVSIGEIMDRFYENGLLTKGGAGLNDSNESWVKEIFTLVRLRWLMFKNKYPFVFDETNNSLAIKSSLNAHDKLYIQLLLSANLPFFSQFQNSLTTDFENISYYSFKKFLNNTLFVKRFGKKSEYSGTNAIEKIKKLANDINIKFSEEDLSQINKYNSNEKGLDVVAWFPFDDDWGNVLVFLGQCACQNLDWHKKRQDAIPYEHFFKFKGIKPIHALFIPHSLTKEKSFFHDINISETLLFDRKRLIDNFDVNDYQHLELNDFIEDITQYKEDIV